MAWSDTDLFRYILHCYVTVKTRDDKMQTRRAVNRRYIHKGTKLPLPLESLHTYGDFILNAGELGVVFHGVHLASNDYEKLRHCAVNLRQVI